MSENVDPLPGTLRTDTLPPSNSASFFDTDRPSPDPFAFPCLVKLIVELGEFLEDARVILRGNTNAGVLYRERHLVIGIDPLRGHPNLDPAP